MKFFLQTVLIICLSAFPALVSAQYKGSPVQKDRLIQTLRSKQFQTRDIVDVILENGVDFKLTAALESELVAAGARPQVVEAVRNNYRNDKSAYAPPVNNKNNAAGKLGNVAVNNKSAGKSYDELLQQAVYAFDAQKNYPGSYEYLRQAVKLAPTNPRAYQQLGFLYLYGFKNFAEAEKNWKLAIIYGGGAVLRVIHDHGGVFLTSCEGSLYITKNIVRFESDDNKHTFEVGDEDIKDIKVNSIFKRLVQLKQGSFKITFRKDSKEDEKNYSFAPLSGNTDESKMIIRLIGKKND